MVNGERHRNEHAYLTFPREPSLVKVESCLVTRYVRC